jgi:hypothetical protein
MARKTRRPPVSRDKRFRKNTSSDSGPPERWQHSGSAIELTETAGVFAVRALHEHVLDRLLPLIGERAREAGLKLHEDYHLARIEEKIGASLSPVRGVKRDPQERLERSAMQEAAYMRWRKGLAVLPLTVRDVAIHVCCVGCAPKLEQLGSLKDALLRLARHYGM